MRNHLLVVLCLVGLGGVARAAGDEIFLGWSADGTYYGIHTDACATPLETLCTSGDQAAVTLPNQLGEIEAGGCTDSQSADAIGQLGRDGVAALVTSGNKKAPVGVKLALKKSKDGAVVTISAGKKKHTETLEDVPDAKLDGAIWRPDGKQVAVSILNRNHDGCSDAHTHAVHLIDISDLGLGGSGPAAGDRKAATAANNKGMGLYKKRQWKPAMEAFRDAIRADASFVLPHYNLASVAALTGELATVRSELGTLSKSSDPDAAKKLDKAKLDPDLDYASTDPEVRGLIGAGDYPEGARERLTERTGVWSTEGETCKQPSIQLKFADQTVKDELMGLKVTLTLDCKGKRTTDKSDEAWDEGPELVALGKLQKVVGADPVSIKWQACPGSKVAGSCFSIKGLGGIFHRGQPEL